MSRRFLAEVEQRTAVEAGGQATGVELLTYHRAKGLEWDAVFLPALEEGTLADPPGEGTRGTRRGAPPAVRRDHPGAALPVAVVGDRGGPGRAAQPLTLPRRARAGVGRAGPGARARRVPRAPPKVAPGDRSPLSNALRAWRTARAKADAIAPFIVFHDTTIEAIAASRPRSIAELRRVPGVGPTKLDRYGEEIIGVVIREG